MEDNNEVEDDTKTYWFSEKPAKTVVVAAVFVFPFVLAYWGFAKVAKAGMVSNMDRKFLKKIGRTMTPVEKVLYLMDLDRKFGI